MTSRSRTVAVLAVVVLVLSACGASQDAELGGAVGPQASSSASEPTPSDPTPSEPTETTTPSEPTTSTVPDAAEPEVGECRDYDLDATNPAVNDAPTVDCAADHTAYTFHVGELTASDNDTLLEEGIAQCLPEFRSSIGWTARDYGGSLASFAFYRPSDEAWERGQRWVRCDLIAQTSEGLLPLPDQPEQIAAESADGGDYAKCLTGSGRSVTCGDDHAYAFAGAFSVKQRRQPSQQRLLSLAGMRCPEIGGDDRWYATWPGTATWAAGDRLVWCWARSGSPV